MLETNENSLWNRFFRTNNIQVSGQAVEFLLTWPKNGPGLKTRPPPFIIKTTKFFQINELS